MENFISPQGKEFYFYSYSHVAALIIIIVFCFLIFLFRNFIKNNRLLKNIYNASISVFIMIHYFIYFFWLIFFDLFDYQYYLPLHLCDITFVLTFFMIITKNDFIFEIVYFLGIGGAVQALLTPSLGYDYPHLMFFHFFLGHSVVIWSSLYMIFVYDKKVTFFSIIRAMIFLNVIGLIILTINFFLKSNYMFLIEKPYSGSLLDLMGPWPVYLIVSDIFAFVFFLILYLPFLKFKKLK
ncbi:MAG: TIGR02206 family membrane protein [Spirochaetes bacterium]|nr:TIGR02206 family membrane protein [Spirochaetota bacterium]